MSCLHGGMAKKGWFGLSKEEQEIDRQRRLTHSRSCLRDLAHTLQDIEVLGEDMEAQVYSLLVEHTLRAYMYLNKVDRPYEETRLMSDLAWRRMKIKREIREEMEED